ncbi:MAG TPA: endonuclease/exonuclease/phosphatase family protein [Vicinamibacterales bacterium]
MSSRLGAPPEGKLSGRREVICDTGRIISSRVLALVISAAVAAGCVRAQAELPRAPTATCRGLVGFAYADATAITWHELSDLAGRRAMAESCNAVGPAVYAAPRQDDVLPYATVDKLAILSWNVHVGGGDVIAIVNALRSGGLTNGEPVRDFVVLLQETFRGGAAVPNTPAGVPIPRRIEAFPPYGPRQDIVQTARALGLGVFYVPSMRNGADEGLTAEDRGTAILSTLPLSNLAAIELPFERQRRVAASASVTGVDAGGNPWQLRLVSAHLNATASVRRLWLFSSAVRARQARHLASVVASDEVPTVIGSDLNSWAGGSSEPAYTELRVRFPQTSIPGGQPTFRGGRMLDYVFLRVPPVWVGQLRTIGNFFGSDHRPLISWIQFRSSP